MQHVPLYPLMSPRKDMHCSQWFLSSLDVVNIDQPEVCTKWACSKCAMNFVRSTWLAWIQWWADHNLKHMNGMEAIRSYAKSGNLDKPQENHPTKSTQNHSPNPKITHLASWYNAWCFAAWNLTVFLTDKQRPSRINCYQCLLHWA